jgi:hypothetical protein
VREAAESIAVRLLEETKTQEVERS